MTLASFVELYFNDREHHVRGTTMDTKRNIFDTKIVPLLGNRKMNEITALDIRDWQQRVKEMGEATGLPYAETYLYTIHAQLTALFNYAQTFYGLQFNTPICTPISSGNSCQGWKLSVLPLPPRMNPI